jgi:hypothetical protein
MKRSWLEIMESDPHIKKNLLSLKAFCYDMTAEETETEYELKLKQSKL